MRSPWFFFLLPRAGLIVPKGELVGLVVAGSERFGQAQIDQRPEPRPRLGAEQRIVHPGFRIVDILRRGDDVEVARDDERLLVSEKRHHPRLQAAHPRQLVSKLLWRAIAVR
jgi:hypothetical protein